MLPSYSTRCFINLTSSQPFYNATLGAGNTKLAATFVPKCTNLPVAERIEMWVKCGRVDEAGREAFKAKNLPALEQLRERASGAQAVEIERMVTQLKPKR